MLPNFEHEALIALSDPHSLHRSVCNILSDVFPLGLNPFVVRVYSCYKTSANTSRGMDGHDRRRQNAPPQYGNPSERFPQGQELPRNFSDGSADRLRQPGPLPRSGSSSRGSAPTISNYGYYNEQTPSFPAAQPVDQMSYQSEYTEESRQQQAAFTGYSPNMPYGVSQEPAASVMYESPQQFQQRQAVPMQILSETSSFYAAESMSAQAPSSMHGAAVGSIGLSQPQSEGLEEPPATLSPVDMGYRRCNTELRQVFQHILNGTLITASQHLLKLSEWLLSHVEDMGKFLHSVSL